jgi:hypothetical protein
LTEEEKKKATHGLAACYQDPVTESVNRDQDNESVSLEDEEDTDLLPPSTGCTIALAVWKVCASFSKDSMLTFFAQLRKIVRHVRSSPQRRTSWKETVTNVMKKAGLTDNVLMLILDVKTRWSSTHQMLRMSHHLTQLTVTELIIMYRTRLGF